MKKKMIILLIVLIIPIMLLCGCSNELAEHNGGYDRFKHICYANGCVLIDKETRVMYLWKHLGSSAGLTVMVNADGTPMIWEGEL